MKLTALVIMEVLAMLDRIKSESVSILKGAVIAAVGAALTYLAASITGYDFGEYQAVAAAAAAVLTNIARKLAFA